jgi:hypothetical protein
MECEEIFGSYKRKANLAPKLEGDSHKHDRVNFFHLHISHTIVNSSVDMEELVMNQIQEDVEVLDTPCGNGIWHIERCALTLCVQCTMFQKSTKHYCATKIITKSISISVLALTYSRLWS